MHGELFNRLTLELNHNEQQSANAATNEEMLIEAYSGNVPGALLQTMFEFGTLPADLFEPSGKLAGKSAGPLEWRLLTSLEF